MTTSRVARNLDVDILEVVFARAADGDGLLHFMSTYDGDCLRRKQKLRGEFERQK